MSTPEESFAAVVDALLAEPGTEAGTGFGKSPGVKREGEIVAMLIKDRLVVKLPADRCAECTPSGVGGPLRMGSGRCARVAVDDVEGADRVGLGREALEFVGGPAAEG